VLRANALVRNVFRVSARPLRWYLRLAMNTNTNNQSCQRMRDAVLHCATLLHCRQCHCSCEMALQTPVLHFPVLHFPKYWSGKFRSCFSGPPFSAPPPLQPNIRDSIVGTLEYLLFEYCSCSWSTCAEQLHMGIMDSAGEGGNCSSGYNNSESRNFEGGIYNVLARSS